MFEAGLGDLPVEPPIQTNPVFADMPAGLVAGQVLFEPFRRRSGRLADVHPAVRANGGAGGVPEVDHINGVVAVSLVGVHHVPEFDQMPFDGLHLLSGRGLVRVDSRATDCPGETGQQVQPRSDGVDFGKSGTMGRSRVQLLDQFFRVVARVAD